MLPEANLKKKIPEILGTLKYRVRVRILGILLFFFSLKSSLKANERRARNMVSGLPDSGFLGLLDVQTGPLMDLTYMA